MTKCKNTLLVFIILAGSRANITEIRQILKLRLEGQVYANSNHGQTNQRMAP
jgi:hypothetical protein